MEKELDCDVCSEIDDVKFCEDCGTDLCLQCRQVYCELHA